MPHTVQRKNHYGVRKHAVGEMNVTPFIDVLLVLLVMLILAVPIKTNITQVDLPTAACENCVIKPDINIVAIDEADQLLWNGETVTRDQMRIQLANANALPDAPLLRFEPAALASYDQSSRTIALIKDTGTQSFAFVGNEKYRDFGL